MICTVTGVVRSQNLVKLSYEPHVTDELGDQVSDETFIVSDELLQVAAEALRDNRKVRPVYRWDDIEAPMQLVALEAP